MQHDEYPSANGERNTLGGAPQAGPESSAEPQLIGFTELVRESFTEARSRLGLVGATLLAFAGITATAMLGMAFLGGIGATVGVSSATGVTVLAVLGLLVFTGILIGYIAAGTALVRVAVDRAMGVGYWDSFRWALRHIWPIILIGLLIQLTTATGYALFILPGIALAMYTAHSYFVFIKEDRRGLTALTRSIDLVYGRWWAVFLRVLGFSVVAMLTIIVPMVVLGVIAKAAPAIGGILIALFLLVAYPFVLVWIVFGMTLIFESLLSLKPAAQFDPDAYRTVRTLLIIAAVLGLPILIGWNILSLAGTFEEPVVNDFQESPIELDVQ